MKILNQLKIILKKSESLYHQMILIVQWFNKTFITDEFFIRIKFLLSLKRRVNLESPILYNDKLQWLKLYWRDNLAPKCADKYAVRDYIKQTIGERYLNELYCVVADSKDIPIEKLPQSFVIKATHGSGFNIIVKDKTKLSIENITKKINYWKKVNYFYKGREWVYKTIQPRIVVEKYLSDDQGNPPMDYKIYCFNGQPKLIQVDIDRFGQHKQNFYDCDWNFRDVHIWCENDQNLILPKPVNFDQMIKIATQLSQSFPHVRVDLYNLDGEIIFGELTFFHLNGFMPFIDHELELEMGSWLDLSTINKEGEFYGREEVK